MDIASPAQTSVFKSDALMQEKLNLPVLHHLF